MKKLLTLSLFALFYMGCGDPDAQDQMPLWQTVTDPTEEIMPGLTLADIRQDATLERPFYDGLYDDKITDFRAWRRDNPTADAHAFEPRLLKQTFGEECDADQTDGIDRDGYDASGVDETEWDAYGAPIAPGWYRCNDHFEGEVPANVSCAVSRGGKTYVDQGAMGVGPGWPTQGNLFRGDIFLFAGDDDTGYCVSTNNGGLGLVADMKGITRCTSSQCWNYWGVEGWRNKTRSNRYGGTGTTGTNRIQFWNGTSYAGSSVQRSGSQVWPGGVDWNVAIVASGWLADSFKVGN